MEMSLLQSLMLLAERLLPLLRLLLLPMSQRKAIADDSGIGQADR
jgi:hypothetical protein